VRRASRHPSERPWQGRRQRAPLPDQRAIADRLDRETTKIDALIARLRESIAQLLEYAAILISAAVTGRIDLRGEAA
jgi:type I restriction enzyme S subunit